ncbi:hypothetical protein [Bryobacter aggregatus]|uniref:hypothetical protein n=1 Tax=Bryobacter aggregatus TaxID=360054 RepID=UPI0004E1FEE3|nr:hypothetical protein [Bryobacter aggregatus]
MLQYLSEKSLAGEAESLKEYTIGLEAFQKPSSYDPRQDSIVRLHVGRLRQKLMAYYQAEAPDAPLRITLPKGGFQLKFEQRPDNPVGADDRTRLKILVGLLLLVTIGTSIGWWNAARSQTPAVSRWTPELEELWTPFLESKRPLLFCLGVPLFVRVPNLGFFRDPRTNTIPEVEKSDRFAAVRKALGVQTDLFPSYAFTGAGEASAVYASTRLLALRKQDMSITRSNLLSWQQVVDNDVVFFGPPKFNLQLQANPMSQEIIIEASGIRNLKPAAGEPAFLEDRIIVGPVAEGVTHALISRTPGLSGEGEFLIMAGNASPDTYAAADWMTNPKRAKELTDRLRGKNGKIPRYFQAVIRVEFKQGIPVQSSYVYHHVLLPGQVKKE